VEPADAWEKVVVGDLEVGYDEGGMSFLCRAKIRFYADVELLGAALELTAAPGAERHGLLDFGQAEERAVKIASGGFTTLRSGDLQMIELGNAGFHRQYKIPAPHLFYAHNGASRGATKRRLPQNR
jgi:hypothetical protein